MEMQAIPTILDDGFACPATAEVTWPGPVWTRAAPVGMSTYQRMVVQFWLRRILAAPTTTRKDRQRRRDMIEDMNRISRHRMHRAGSAMRRAYRARRRTRRFR